MSRFHVQVAEDGTPLDCGLNVDWRCGANEFRDRFLECGVYIRMIKAVLRL